MDPRHDADGSGTYSSSVSIEGEGASQPAWAVSIERGEDASTTFRDERGDPLVALAVTREEVTRLIRGLAGLPQDAATAALLDRLRTLHADFHESAG